MNYKNSPLDVSRLSIHVLNFRDETVSLSPYFSLTKKEIKMFDLFVTCVKKEHGLVKIFGQTDVSTGRSFKPPRRIQIRSS